MCCESLRKDTSVLKVDLTVEPFVLLKNNLFLKEYDLGDATLLEKILSLFGLTFPLRKLGFRA